MRQGRVSKKRIIITAAVAVVLIVAFGLIMYLIEQHGLLDEQFGDTGSWGSGDELQIELADTLYTTDDSVDTYLLMDTEENENYPLMTSRLMKKGTGKLCSGPVFLCPSEKYFGNKMVIYSF